MGCREILEETIMNWKAVMLAVAATLVDPITVTINELAEHVDDIEKTVFNADYVIRGWGRWLTLVLGGGYLLRQNATKPTE